MDESGYSTLISYISEELQIDGTLYKERPFKRRIKLRMRYTDTETYNDYLVYLRQHPEEKDILKDTITINVTRFFRNRDAFESIESMMKDDFIRKNKYIKVLSVGCSSGEEPYTIGLMLHNLKRMYDFGYSVTGIDVDEQIIEKARKGIYPSFSMKELSPQEKVKYFEETNEHFYLKGEYRKNIDFKIVNIKDFGMLRKLGNFDIILCRNVLIYFSKEFQEMIMQVYHEMLNENGILMLGKIEIVMGNFRNYFEVIDKKQRIYRKIGN